MTHEQAYKNALWFEYAVGLGSGLLLGSMATLCWAAKVVF